MTQEELLNIVHELRNNKDCSDEQLCEVIKAANQTITLENIAKLIGERPATEKNKGKKAAVKFTQKEISSDAIARHVKDYFEGHRTHDLRHTFITRAQEVAIRREIVSLWVGHAPDSSITSLIYTHLEFNEQLQLDEIKKFDYVP